MRPFKLPKWLPCEKLMSVANELIPDSAVTDSAGTKHTLLLFLFGYPIHSDICKK